VEALHLVRWQDWSGTGIEHLTLRTGPDGIDAESVVIGPAEEPIFAVRYAIACDDRWHVRTVRVELVGGDRRVELSSDGDGRWTDATGHPLPELAGAIDVDLTATPFTNTLPIWRLGLTAGGTAEILVAYIVVPDLSVALERQRYTCLETGRRYRFESLDGDFARDIDVDEHGLVLTYPGLFRRVVQAP